MGYRPIAEYAAIGNDDRCALIDRHGSIDWCCFPHVASPSVFARLLDDERGGHFSIQPTADHEARHAYLDRTNVLQASFQTRAGLATLTDFMPIAETGDPQRSIYRRIRSHEGRMRIQVDYKPRPDYARADTVLERSDEDIVAEGGDDRLHLQTLGPPRLSVQDGRAVGTATLEAGDSAWFVLQHDHHEVVSWADCRRRKDETIEHWRRWSKGLEQDVDRIVGEEPWREAVVRSALVLKLLIHGSSGAIYAAPTTSLPETYGGERNWDYRYNWIRDAKFTVQVLSALGEHDEVEDYFDWFRKISHEDPGAIQPVYGVHGERELSETELDHLAGYWFSRPVRVGNAAAEQRQLDIYGTIVQGLFETQLQQEASFTDEDWMSIRRLVDHVCEVWRDPDEGIWEFREGPHHYVHSKLLCWVALDRGLRLAEDGEREAPVDRWRRERTEIREAIEEQGYSQDLGSFVQHFDTDDRLDATCLLIPIYGLLGPDDERVQRTVDTVIDELLTEEGLVYRTRAEAETEGRGAFLLCTYWLVNALVLADRIDEAREIYRGVLDHVEPPTLLAERIDPATSEFLGNYPQAFSHIGLINSALYLASAERKVDRPYDSIVDPGPRPLFDG